MKLALVHGGARLSKNFASQPIREFKYSFRIARYFALVWQRLVGNALAQHVSSTTWGRRSISASCLRTVLSGNHTIDRLKHTVKNMLILLNVLFYAALIASMVLKSFIRVIPI
jgi:hypothetical protein